jgi:hypothetical protein
MTDMPEFRAWADQAFRSSMHRPKAQKTATRYKCVNGACNSGTTRRQAAVNGCSCRMCGADLISKTKLQADFGAGGS